METSQLICRVNQLTGFYIMKTLVVKRLNTKKSCQVSDTPTKILKLTSIISEYFQNSRTPIHLKANPRKCHSLLCSKTLTDVSIGDASHTNGTKETFLGILINSKLSFDQHASSICSKDSKKLRKCSRKRC